MRTESSVTGVCATKLTAVGGMRMTCSVTWVYGRDFGLTKAHAHSAVAHDICGVDLRKLPIVSDTG
jgi:hypothetical protein